MSSRNARSFCALLLIVLASGCDWLTSTRVQIHNQSDSPFTNVYVDLPGKRLAAGDLMAGESTTVSGSPKKDGGMVIEYMRAGRLVRHEITYVTPVAGVSCDVVVANESFQRTCRTR
jgi:hypothetical protein